MKIIIRQDALELYINQHTDHQGHYTGKDSWEFVMKQIAGKTLDVDIEHLFKCEFNTKEIRGVSISGIRIPDIYVEKVLNDHRIGKARCEFCEHTSHSTQYCTYCGRSDYLDQLIEQ